MSHSAKLTLVALFAIAMAFLESAVVIYLRAIYYPEGFSIILKEFSPLHLRVELARELATIVMLFAVAWLVGRKAWERFGWFSILFGVWDIFYYVWLKLAIDWPSALTDCDILFLIPIPWIGPVIAPTLISLLLVICGLMITGRYARGGILRVSLVTWLMSLAGSAVILYSFMVGASRVLSKQAPEPYHYELLALGLVLLLVGFWVSYRKTRRH